jgi:uncharacterized membrane protein
MKNVSRNLAMAGIIGALYAVLTILLAPISYGPIQVRIAEALTILPFFFPSAIPGLYVGCMAANIFGGFGPIDIFGGSALTLLAAFATYWTGKINRPWLAPLPPVIINAFGVSLYLHVLSGLPYWLTVLYIGIGQTIACYGLGLPLLHLLKRKNFHI